MTHSCHSYVVNVQKGFGTVVNAVNTSPTLTRLLYYCTAPILMIDSRGQAEFENIGAESGTVFLAVQ